MYCGELSIMQSAAPRNMPPLAFLKEPPPQVRPCACGTAATTRGSSRQQPLVRGGQDVSGVLLTSDGGTQRWGVSRTVAGPGMCIAPEAGPTPQQLCSNAWMGR